MASGSAEGPASAAAPAAGAENKAIKSNRPVARMGRRKEVDPAEEAQLQLYLAKKLGVTAVASAVDQTVEGEPPKKKKKLGKKERERAKAAKAASESKVGEAQAAATANGSMAATSPTSGLAAEEGSTDKGKPGKMKRASKKRRMYERLGMGIPLGERLERKEKTARRKKAKALLREIAARQVVQPAKAT